MMMKTHTLLWNMLSSGFLDFLRYLKYIYIYIYININLYKYIYKRVHEQIR